MSEILYSKHVFYKKKINVVILYMYVWKKSISYPIIFIFPYIF